VGCIGLCAQEPLLDIQQGAEPRVTYANVTPKMVPRIIQEHLVEGHVIDKWVFGRVKLEAVDER
jgi:(2Fe-2S) ferredoxin